MANLKHIDLGLSFVPTVIYACFALHNFCEKHGMTVEDDVARQIAHFFFFFFFFFINWLHNYNYIQHKKKYLYKKN